MKSLSQHICLCGQPVSQRDYEWLGSPIIPICMECEFAELPQPGPFWDEVQRDGTVRNTYWDAIEHQLRLLDELITDRQRDALLHQMQAETANDNAVADLDLAEAAE